MDDDYQAINEKGNSHSTKSEYFLYKDIEKNGVRIERDNNPSKLNNNIYTNLVMSSKNAHKKQNNI